MKLLVFPIILLSILFSLGACTPQSESDPSESATRGEIQCDPYDGGLQLPSGFCATVYADSIGRARHLAVLPNGVVYVKLRRGERGGSVVALRDLNGDGKADEQQYFTNEAWGGTGIGYYNGYLYYSSDLAIYRQRIDWGALAQTAPVETVVRGFGGERQHAAKPFTFDGRGGLYVNVGAPSNACQRESRTEESPGRDPCPLLDRYGGIWKFYADTLGQDQRFDGYRYVTGVRNMVALRWNHTVGKLFGVMHGRDQLAQLWPAYYTYAESAELPAEEFMMMEEGDDFGWPYCYYDQHQGRKVLAPEYGGDGMAVQRCIDKKMPLFGFPAHYAPNDLLFYRGSTFPDKYLGGAFIAFHGSWNRAPEVQAGYFVAFVPMNGERITGNWEIFANGFTGKASPIVNPAESAHRPMGLAEGPDGAIYIADSVVGRIWKVAYVGG